MQFLQFFPFLTKFFFFLLIKHLIKKNGPCHQLLNSKDILSNLSLKKKNYFFIHRHLPLLKPIVFLKEDFIPKNFL
jgi:hypothetical protein